MKSPNVDNSYSLDNIDNYYKELKEDINEIMNRYIELIKQYLNFVNDNIKIKNKQYIKFIIKRGIDTITNVFLNILYYTKNLNLTYYHCQKSFYFYVEFIGQITEDQHVYLQLSSRDAATYVYRKTIFEINNEYRKNITMPSNNTSNKFKLINIHIDIYKSLTQKFIELNVDEQLNINDDLSKIHSKLKALTLNLYELKNINLLVNVLDNKIQDKNRFIETLVFYLKKINKNTNLTLNINDKIKNEDFDLYIDETIDKFVNWLIS
jgi:hypothetical protein